MSDGFTNRHGHSFSAEKLNADTLPEPAHTTEVPKPPRRRRKKRGVSTAAKRTILGLVVAVIALPLLVGEYVRMSYSTEIADAKQALSALFDQAVASQKTEVKSEILRSRDQQLAEIRDKLCSGGMFDNLAQLYPRSQSAFKECNNFRTNVAQLETSVKMAAEQLSYLEQLQPLLGGVTKPLEDQFAVLAAQQENWQQFVTGMRQLSPPSTFSSAHSGVVQSAEAVRDQWIALVQASNVFDSSKFNEARVKLAAAYKEFQSRSTEFTSAIQTTQQSLTQQIAALK